MIYIVTGRHRSGTSLLMHALSEGSVLAPLVSIKMEQHIRKNELDTGNYNPNPNGYFHPGYDVDLTALPTGTLVKLNLPQFLQLQLPDEYKIVCTSRNEEERQLSFERAFGIDNSMYAPAEEFLQSLLNVTYINYADIIKDALSVFTQLESNGWPIFPLAAAQIVNPELYRNRIED